MLITTRYLLLALALSTPGWADQSSHPAAAQTDGTPTLSFGIVPQQSASKLARLWSPILEEIGARAGVQIGFRTAPDIPTFERRLAAGEYDLAYMNPYHYTVFSRDPGYRAFAHQTGPGAAGGAAGFPDHGHYRAGRQGTGLPAPAAFAATLLPQAALRNARIPIEPRYVRLHDSVYRAVAQGLYPAGGGIERTFEGAEPEVREQLRVLWMTPAFTPHAFAAHPRVAPEVVVKIRDAMVALGETPEGAELLHSIEIKGVQPAEDADWDDVRAFRIDLPIDTSNPDSGK